MQHYILEVIAFNAKDCLLAENAGADRIELCSNPIEGGITPSYGAIKESRNLTKLPIYCMIRPRGGGFNYNNSETNIMLEDISIAIDLGCNGLVLGVLTEQKAIHEKILEKLVLKAGKTPITFHRAFDHVLDPIKSLETLKAYQIERVLTSGQANTAIQGLPLINELIDHSKNKIIIMPGCGIRHNNLLTLLQNSTATEFHTSARINNNLNEYPILENSQLHKQSYTKLDTEEVIKCKKILNNYLKYNDKNI